MKWVVASALLCVLLTDVGTAQKGSDALVITAESFAVNGKPLERGTLLQADALMTAVNTGSLALSCRDIIWLYSCRQASCRVSACAESGEGIAARQWTFAPTKSFTPPAPTRSESVAPEGLIGRVLSALFAREPKNLITAAARGLGDPVDAVVLQDDRGVHWGPALEGVLEDKFCLRVRPVSGAAAPLSTGVMPWDKRLDPEGIAPVPGLAPGLYAVDKGSPSAAGCRVDAEQESAWVLVASSAEFASLGDEWREQAARLTAIERDGASPAVVSSLRHAALAWLAQPK